MKDLYQINKTFRGFSQLYVVVGYNRIDNDMEQESIDNDSLFIYLDSEEEAEYISEALHLRS